MMTGGRKLKLEVLATIDDVGCHLDATSTATPTATPAATSVVICYHPGWLPLAPLFGKLIRYAEKKQNRRHEYILSLQTSRLLLLDS
jgi:hypothetical protein